MQATSNNDYIYTKYKEKIKKYQKIISEKAKNAADFILEKSDLQSNDIVSMLDVLDHFRNIDPKAKIAIYKLYNIMDFRNTDIREALQNSVLKAKAFQDFAVHETLNAFKECHDCHHHELYSMHGEFEQLDISQHHEM